MSNRLQHETSPYLLQHAQNPVDWYPWGKDAFEKARREDKPIFLSIGYSTCHWCHVMAHESFENEQIAELLNRYYIPIKVDREERPDVDQIYMSACQAMTGGGGWPMSVFLTPEKKPFFAGTYFPPMERHGMPGFYNLLWDIANSWRTDKATLKNSADEITAYLQKPQKTEVKKGQNLLEKAAFQFRQMYDKKNGGFGRAPKFPTPHNLLFLMLYGKLKGSRETIDMALHTLLQMRKGGIYDHIGGGFSRYSTDKLFLVPHFEKMLYDNALLIIAYAAAYAVSGEEVFLHTAKECAEYVFEEMTSPEGGFYSAQDADSEGGEGMYYIFGYDEILSVLGTEKGKEFNEYFGISREGNFEGKNIPNRLHGEIEAEAFLEERQKIYQYRKSRMKLHLDDKTLTSWNALMIAAMAVLYRVSGDGKYLDVACKAKELIESKLCENDRLYVSIREGNRSGKAFLDDYAFYAAALLTIFSATGEADYLERAKQLAHIAEELFRDVSGGYLMNGKENEELIFAAKESYDGAMPSGNSVFGFVLTRLAQLDWEGDWQNLQKRQEEFLAQESAEYPAGHSMFLLSLLFAENPPQKIVVVCAAAEERHSLLQKLPLYADLTLLPEETDEYKLANGKTTFYICRNQTCLPPTNDISAVNNNESAKI